MPGGCVALGLLRASLQPQPRTLLPLAPSHALNRSLDEAPESPLTHLRWPDPSSPAAACSPQTLAACGLAAPRVARA